MDEEVKSLVSAWWITVNYTFGDQEFFPFLVQTFRWHKRQELL